MDHLSISKVKDDYGKRIAKARMISHVKSSLIDGLSNRYSPIYGRIFSGEIDTNRGGGIANAIATLTISSLVGGYQFRRVVESIQRRNSLNPHSSLPFLMVMGDDNLLIENSRVNQSQYSTLMKEIFNLDVSHEKGESGLFFLQRRLFRVHGKDKVVMITPFTRVLRSLLFKENRKGLGPAG